ncbi:hypothetical protein MH171_001879 [Vibrio parahaemolyticus]|nr:hypothetical protein [Vibrio parahaemolyticus]ELA7254409.1 hypothetical protein [Vibrio parahaemolyticus]EMF1839578.1 hypothetical protein [Vibrio parahaemolyticus]
MSKILAKPNDNQKVKPVVDAIQQRYLTNEYFIKNPIDFSKSKIELGSIKRPESTITIHVCNPKGGSSKTTGNELVTYSLNLIAYSSQNPDFTFNNPLNVGIVTADRNEGLVRRYTDSYLKNHFSSSIKNHFIGVEYGDDESSDKSMYQINTDVRDKLVPASKISPQNRKKHGIDSESENTYFIEKKGNDNEEEYTKLDFSIWDLAAGTNELETDKADRVLITCKMAESESIDNALITLKQKLKRQHEEVLAMLKEQGFAGTDEQIIAYKAAQKTVHTVLISNNTNKQSYISIMNDVKYRIQSICSEFLEDVNLIEVPYFPLDTFRKLNVNPTIPTDQWNAYKRTVRGVEGLYLNNVKCIEQRPDMVDFMKELVEVIGG